MKDDTNLARTLKRADLITDSVKGLLLVNGGTAVALLSFLPNAMDRSAELAQHALVGVGIACLGLGLALPVQPLRVFHSRRVDGPVKGRNSCFRPAYYACLFASMLCFLAAVGYLLLKGLPVLSKMQPL